MTLLPAAVLFAGCTPHDAEIQADYAVFLAAASSENIHRLERTGVDVEGKPGALGLTPIDCRDLSGLDDAETIAAERLQNVDYAADCCESGTGEDCNSPKSPSWFGWLDDYAYYLNEGKVDPWRTEAVLTTEGDLQLTVHMDFPKIGDLRFGWVIDPNFQPQECVDGEDGSELQDVDGDWLEGWSANEEGTLWHLNAGAYQVNPSDNGDYWSFDDEWQAGYTFARFGDEEFYGHALDYADEAYSPFYFNTYGGPTDGYTGIPGPLSGGEYTGWVSRVGDYFDELTDLSDLGKSDFPLEMKVEDNSWRPDDGEAAGLDGWVGVSPSWVRIDNPGDIGVHPENPITGEFQVELDGLAAASKLFVRGTFTLNDVREDVWGYDKGTLDEVKREENNTPTCGESSDTTGTASAE